jgi:hypothetical protein
MEIDPFANCNAGVSAAHQISMHGSFMENLARLALLNLGY